MWDKSPERRMITTGRSTWKDLSIESDGTFVSCKITHLRTLGRGRGRGFESGRGNCNQDQGQQQNHAEGGGQFRGRGSQRGHRNFQRNDSGFEDVNGDSSGSEKSLDEELGFPYVKTPGVRRAHADDTRRSDPGPRRSGRMRNSVQRLTYDTGSIAARKETHRLQMGLQGKHNAGRYAQRVGSRALVYLAAMLEYLAEEVLELSENAARDNKKDRIILRHIQLAVRNNEELGRLLGHVTIANGGVLPNIHSVLLPKKSMEKTSKASSAS
ncbi:hypothetical protein KP509_04G057000 [Ceratopteris richardii]|uniref:Histone H2A n=1 Tax=Ceratopteris richardii TaxID=49495 RepID=A0A8T2UX57_CERRI|nr:hypothetical protein KP509_04G057000 [Ceratopteris richardii]